MTTRRGFLKTGVAGALQSVYSDHFLKQAAVDGPLGFKLEAPPLHPVLFATTLQGRGEAHARLMREFANSQVLLALVRDGFHPESRGGRVKLRDDGSPLLDYPLNETFWEAARRALLAMAEIQFAAGAKWVTPVHESATGYTTWGEAKLGIANLSFAPLRCRVVSDEGRHFQIDNLSVHDGSLFPTSIGANPQLSIYGLVARNASLLAAALSGRPRPAIL
jgi:GMC oxidoreductase